MQTPVLVGKWFVAAALLYISWVFSSDRRSFFTLWWAATGLWFHPCSQFSLGPTRQCVTSVLEIGSGNSRSKQKMQHTNKQCKRSANKNWSRMKAAMPYMEIYNYISHSCNASSSLISPLYDFLAYWGIIWGHALNISTKLTLVYF